MTRNITPAYARQMFLESKRGQIRESSLRAYKYPTKHLMVFLKDEEVETMAEADGFLIEQWRLARKREDIADATLKNDCKKVATFLRWCAAKNIVEDGLGDKMTIPRISENAMVSSEMVALPQAEELLNHLEKYEYATLYHTLFAVMWHTGCRISGAIALDIGDFVQDPVPAENDPDPAPYLKFRNRPEQGTGLKNRAKSAT